MLDAEHLPHCDAARGHAEHAPAADAYLELHSLRAALWLTLRASRELGPLAGLLERFPVLCTFVDAAASAGLEGLTLEAAIAQLDRRAGELRKHGSRGPLSRLADALTLDADGLSVLLTCVLSDREPLLAPLLDALRGHEGRPTAALLAETEQAAKALEALLAAGFLCEQRAGRWRVYEVPNPVLDALHGFAPRAWPHREARDLPGFDVLILPDPLRAELQRECTRMPGSPPCWALRGAAGSGRRAIAAALARATGHGLLEVPPHVSEPQLSALASTCTLLGAVPLLTYRPAPGERIQLPELSGYRGPLAVRLPSHGGVCSGRRSLRSFELALPDAEERHLHWASALEREEIEPTLAELRIGRGSIHQIALDAGDTATLDAARVVSELEARGRFRLDGLAQRVAPFTRHETLTLEETLEHDFAALLSRCRHREALRNRLPAAFGHTGSAGVRAVFQGPSGTGKTLAARKLACDLGRPLYRVDLASVVSKYIGETERNLERVFEAAESLDIVLLLDEGDALLARRTEVANANDRYANLETNFLLQRMESYDGILIVTSNAAERIDRAFLRRMDATLDFTLPDARARRELWQTHLPPDHEIDALLLDQVAQRCVISGGQIRGAALHATLLGLDHGKPMAASQLVAALRREYRRAGQSCPSLAEV